MLGPALLNALGVAHTPPDRSPHVIPLYTYGGCGAKRPRRTAARTLTDEPQPPERRPAILDPASPGTAA